MRRLLSSISVFFLLFASPAFAQTYQTSQTLTTDVGKPTVQTCATIGDCVAKVKQIGISLGGNLTQDRATRTYETLALMSQKAPNFIRLLKLSTPLSITFHEGGCAGHANYDAVDIYGSCRAAIGSRFILMHELGHVVAFRNPSIFAKFYNDQVWWKNVLPTWDCQLDYGPNGPYAAECWADMIGQYPVYSQYREIVNGEPPYKYPVTFPDFPTFANGYYYGFARSNIFNGATF